MTDHLELLHKHHALLHAVWYIGGGLALQPQLLEFMVSLHEYSSEMTCRRGIQALKTARLIKSEAWLDNKSQVLILCKPAIAYLLDEPSQKVASIPNYHTREPEWASIFRFWYLQQYIPKHNFASFDALWNFFNHITQTLFLRQTDLPVFWDRMSDSNFLDDSAYCLQANKMRERFMSNPVLRNAYSPDIEKSTLPGFNFSKSTTLLSIHARKLFLLGCSEATNRLRIGFFTLRDTTPIKILDLAVFCQDWVRGLRSDCHIEFHVFVKSAEEAQSLQEKLEADCDWGPFWKAKSHYALDGYDKCPITVIGTDLLARYVKNPPIDSNMFKRDRKKKGD